LFEYNNGVADFTSPVGYAEIEPDNSGVTGRITRGFLFENIAPGTYSLRISKEGHTVFIVHNVVVDGDVDLGERYVDGVTLQNIELIPGDFDGSNTVDAIDVAMLMNNFGLVSGMFEEMHRFNINGDELVDVMDVAIILGFIGRTGVEITLDDPA
jgi:hypothetical protein